MTLKGNQGFLNDKITAWSLGILTLVFIIFASFSLRWKIVHDVTLLHYIAFLIDRYDYVPYRDIYDFNMPGAYLFHMLIGRTVGYGDLGFRLFDLMWLGCILAITWKIMGRYGWNVAWGSTLMVGFGYLAAGPWVSLQRDWVLILPLSLAIATACSDRLGCKRRYFLIGTFLGIAVAIKPHAVLAFPVLMAFEILKNHSSQRPTRKRLFFVCCIFSITALLIPVMAVFLWIWRLGGISPFVEIITKYLPLYAQLSGQHEALLGMERLRYLFSSVFKLGNIGLLAASACLGAYIVLAEDGELANKRLAYLLVALIGVFILYTSIYAKFWPYHWMPMKYCLYLLSGLCLVPPLRRESNRIRRWFPLLLFGIVICTLLIQASGNAIFLPKSAKEHRIERVANFLLTHCREGDKVQPLDWTEGTIGGMLKARCNIATPFICDFHFYHNVSNSYIQSLRNRFLKALVKTMPRFIIKVEVREWPSGIDTSRTFPELIEFIDANYVLAQPGVKFKIYERRP